MKRDRSSRLWVIGALAVVSCVLPEYTNNRRGADSTAEGGGSGAGTDAGGSHAGAAGSGGRHAGGTGSGGVASTLATLGGATASGGSSPLGGTTAIGGTPASGGSSPLGGTTAIGGTPASGGSSPKGGESATGGTTATGGSTASGGSSAIGGTNSAGGTTTTRSTRACPSGYADCDGTCLQVASDVNNCGACGKVCTGMGAAWKCDAGICLVASCQAGFGDCDKRDSTGCEADLTGSDPKHCGDCTTSCKYPICGTGGGTAAKAYCYFEEVAGANTAVGPAQYAAAGWLQGYLQGTDEKPDQWLVALGAVEMQESTDYYLGLYEDSLKQPTNLVWVSPLQHSVGTLTSPHVNEILVPSPIKLRPSTIYWLVMLSVKGQLGVSSQSTGALPNLDYYLFGSGFATMPPSMASIAGSPATDRNVPAVFFTTVSPQ